jgi:Lon protease-like protein
MPSSTIPIFPLPTVVLFPNVFLPLHIFEPRYRQMVADALSGDRVIGMTLLKEAATVDDGRPPVYAVGCSGVITHVERLADGRFNIILRGVEKFEIVGEETPAPGQLYRTALISPCDEAVAGAEREALTFERRRLENRLAPLFERARAESFLPQTMPDADLVNALAQYLEFEPVERQALLEQPGPLARCRAMMELLDVKALLEKTVTADGGTVH